MSALAIGLAYWGLLCDDDSVMSTLFCWEDFYHLACEWKSQVPARSEHQEALCRCVVSRAYYAVLQSCRAYANQTPRALPASGDSHSDVITWFFRGTSAEHKEIATSLDRLRKARRIADYEAAWKKTTPQNAAQDALFYANRILNTLGGLEDEAT
jgi:hypothetical protein